MNQEDVQKLSNAANAKITLLKNDFFKYFMRAIMAGFFIVVAMIFSNVVGNVFSGAEEPAWGKFLGALVFSIAVLLISLVGGELFTGNNLIVISVLQKKVTWLQMLKNWGMVFMGNFIGAFFVAFMVVYAGIPELYGGVLGEKMVAAALFRVNQSFGEAFARGVLCNILVCIAVWAAFAAKKVSGKLLMSFWPVMLFVLCGFEHSIADIYFGVSGLLTMDKYGISAPELTTAAFLLKNLLPVTLGNIVGGAGIVGCGYWAVYLRHTPGFAEPIEAEQEEIDGAEEY